MDFPKSVPGVGLVGGVFVDENAAIGRVGSLIPSAWGNAVTKEILAVIEAAGLQPAEAQTDQLLAAIRALVPERSTFTRVTGTQALPAGAFGIYALADGGAAATVTLPSLDDLVDETELLVFAAHANTQAVQVKAGPAQTIQGPAALMSGSTVAFTLPANLGAWVGLRSEKDQGRWVVFYSYEAEKYALPATTATAGIVSLATNAQAQAGTDASRAVTPAALAFADQPFFSSSATLTSTDNKMVMTSVVTTLGLEKGDVVELTIASPAYKKMHTVESITGAGELVLNYEHCGARGNGSLKLPDYSGSVTIKRVVKWFNAPTGLGQGWVNVKAFRSTALNYDNTTNRLIVATARASSISSGSYAEVYVTVDGSVLVLSRVPVPSSSWSPEASVTTLIPAGSQYSWNLGASSSSYTFLELR